MTISVFQLQQMQARLANNSRRSGEVRDEVRSNIGRERELHEMIDSECRRRGWIALTGSMAHRAYRPLGEPDYLIVADNGRWFAIECKARLGKLTVEQMAMKAHFEKLGHEYHVIRDFGQFLTVITPMKVPK